MLILLYGEDTFRSRQKLNEIIKGYQAKHQSGLNLIYIKEGRANWDKFRTAVESVSMFNEKKLIVLEDILGDKAFRKNFLDYFKKNKLKNNPDVIVVVYQTGKFSFPEIKRQANMFEEFKLLDNLNLERWIRKKVKAAHFEIAPAAVKKIIACVGNNLWQMNGEIEKLINYSKNNSSQIDEAAVGLLVKGQIDLNIFELLDSLSHRDKKTAWRLFHQHLQQGENEFYLFSMLVYQMRTLVKLKDLVERGAPYYQLARISGLHPFVVKKSWSILRNFSLSQLKNIYHHLLEIETGVKSGRFDVTTALDLFISGL